MITDKQAKIFVAGHKGMVGSAIVRALQAQGYHNLLLADRATLDLTNQAATQAFYAAERPDYVIVAAAKVGGIHANNTYPANFLVENLMMECNLIQGAFDVGCTNLLFLGSSCIYPKLAPQPIQEDALLNGYLEPTNEAYAIAKIAGIKLCESFNRQHNTDYRALMPTNLYGPGDNFHPENSHVIPALMRRIHEAKRSNSADVVIWGSGTPMREFLHVDDLAAACLHMMTLPKAQLDAAISPMMSHINVGTGVDVTIRELAQTLVEVIGFEGKLAFDSTKPDGTPRKLLDVSKINDLGWQAKFDLQNGLESTYAWFLENEADLRR
jgi:GDP-L-fucose synthase